MRRCLPLLLLATILQPSVASSARAQGPPAVVSSTRAQPAAAVHSPVVLTFPFENTGEEASIEWLSEGLAELSIQRLSGRGFYLLSRQERLDELEKVGLPVSTRFSRATMIKLGEGADADEVVFGSYSSDGNSLTMTARVLHMASPSLSDEFVQSGAMSEYMTIHSRLAGQLLCALGRSAGSAMPCDASNPAVVSIASQPPPVSPAAFEAYIRGITDSNDSERLKSLREAARLEPKWDAPAFAIGDSYFSRRSCEAALPWLNRVAATSANGVQAAFEAGACYLLRGDPARAQTTYGALLSRQSRERLPEAVSNLGVALARQGKLVEAAAAFEQATRTDSAEPDYWFNLGVLRFRAQQLEAAVDPLRRVLTLQPGDSEARTLLAIALEQTGRGDEANAERAVLSRTSSRVVVPRDPAIANYSRFDRIRMRFDPGTLRPAAVLNTTSNEAPPVTMRGSQRVALHLERGRQFLESGNLDDAQRAFIEALLLAPLDADAHAGLAEVYDRQGRPTDGVREYRAALATRNDLKIRVALAGLLVRQDRVAEARVELQRVIDSDPNNAEAQDLLDQLNNRSTSAGTP